MRGRHVHRATLVRHTLAALVLSCRHLHARREAGHRRVAKQGCQQQDACELAEDTHTQNYFTPILDTKVELVVTFVKVTLSRPIGTECLPP